MRITNNRRDVLKGIGLATLGAATVGSASSTAAAASQEGYPNGTIHKQDNLLPEDHDQASYSYGSIHPDGHLACSASFGTIGATLFDVSDPSNIEELHSVESFEGAGANDVKFDPDREVYYVSQEPNAPEGLAGFFVVDYGWGDGTRDDPEIIAEFEAPNTGVHKLDVHPDEPVLYATDKALDEPGLITVDITDPANPEHVDDDQILRGPEAYLHDMEPDAERGLLYGANAIGEEMGIVIWDIGYDEGTPDDPQLVTFIDYDERPDYEEIGEPGYQICHQVTYDPDRALLVVGDELGGGAFGMTPGGKHIWDIGWDEGTPEEPEHIGFTHSPNAEEFFGYTTHFAEVIPKSHTDGSTFIVDGGYHEGVWLCDITDPTDPTPSEQYPTIDGMDEFDPRPAWCWGADYSMSEQFVFATDSGTGVYTFEVEDEPFEFRTPLEEIEQTFDPTDEVDMRTLRLALAYWKDHDTVPNTNGEPMTTGVLRDVVDAWRQG